MSDLTDADQVFRQAEAHAATRASAETTAIVVAGMHRSGTSAFVRVLNLLGIDLPATLYPARPDNPVGYWEPLHVVEAHDEFLAAIGSSFDDAFSLPDGALQGASAHALEDRVLQILETEFAGSSQFVVKDPRICRLVPIWIAALERFGAAPRFVLPIRNPLEVAASLKLRNEYGTTKSLLLWLRHVLEAERHTRGLRRIVVSYEQLLRDWQGVVDGIAHEFALVWPRASHEAHAEIEQFLSPRRRHHSFNLDELQARTDVVDWVKTTYELLAAGAEGEQLEEDILDALRGELDRADHAFGPLIAEQILVQRSQEKALSEQAVTLAEVQTAGEKAAQDLAERNRAFYEAAEEMKRLETELTLREETLNVTVAEAATTREQIEKLRAELAERERVVAEARAEVPRLASELAQGEEMLKAALAETEATRERMEELRAELAEREQALAEAQGDVPRLMAELTQQRDALATARGEVDRLQAELTEARAEIPRLAAELTQREETLNAALAETEATREQMEELQAELAEREQALAEAQGDVPRLMAELTQQRDALATARGEVDRLQAELAVRDRELTEARADVPRLASELAEREEERTEAEASALRLEELLETIVKESAARDARLQGVLNEVGNLRIESARRGGRLAAARSALAEGRRQRQQLSRELGRRTDALAAREFESERLLTEIQALRMANADLEDCVSLLEAEKSELGSAISALENEADRTSMDAQRRAALAEEEFRAVRAELDSRVSLLEAEKSELGSAISALENEADRTSMDAQRRAALMEAELSATRAKLTETESVLEVLQIRRFVRPRTKWLAFSQVGSWLMHPHRGGWRLIRQYLRVRSSGTFSAEAYLVENPDVDASGLDPLMHYVEHGVHEGRILAPPQSEGAVVAVPASPALGPGAPAAAALPGALAEASPVPAPESVAESPIAEQASQWGVPSADYGDFIVLLSRQRSGTTPLRSILESHPDIFSLNQVFSPPGTVSAQPLLREANFFTFLERYSQDDALLTMPDRHERLLLDYLEYLRCLSQKPYTLIDVKYDTADWPAGTGHDHDGSDLLDLMIKHGLYIVNVTRRNYLRSIVSREKASHSNCYAVPDGTAYADATQYVDPDFLLRELSACLDEDRRIQQRLTPDERVLTYDYAEIFPGNGTAISSHFLEQFASWRGIANTFADKPAFRKLSSLPLRETLENYDEVAAALRDGPFAYCLEDEPAYRFSEAQPLPAMPRGRVMRASYNYSAREGWRDVIGSDPDLFCSTFYRARPSWIEGSLSEDDARFLFQQVLTSSANHAVEIGTGSGLSTAILAHGMNFRAAAGEAPQDWKVQSHDFSEHLWFDPDRPVGDAARELLAEPLLGHLEFNSPSLAVDVAERHPADSIQFLFLDANHMHPWPALDLLGVLAPLEAGAIVVLHDVNLPHIHPEFPEWGVNHVFEELDVEKMIPDVPLPNIGAIIVPSAKGRLRDQLIGIAQRRPWEDDSMSDDFVSRVVSGAERIAD